MSVVFIFYSAPGVHALTIPTFEPSSCNDLHHCRTIWSIVWSCLVTIFACTWVAVHPNIPDSSEGSVKVGLRHAGIMIMALIAPELVIMWAIRQWINARSLAKQYKMYGWTMTHGFFALMGGFMVFEDNKDPQPRTLDPFKLEDYLARGEIDITIQEIQDRSKSDSLSKGLVIVQTGWFILQCIARQMEHLPMSELEIVTLAFAMLNFFTYGLWWNKPLSVQCPYRVLINRKPMSEEKEEAQGDCETEAETEVEAREEGETEQERLTQSGQKDIWSPTVAHPLLTIIYNAPAAIWNTFWSIITNGLLVLLMPFAYMVGFEDHGIMERKTSTFYAGKLTATETRVAYFIASGIAALFGSIHCIAWSFKFPSDTEQFLWHISSVAITCIPLALPLVFGIRKAWENWAVDWVPHCVSRQMEWFFVVLLRNVIFSSSPIPYIMARIILLALAFTSLQSLPAEAYQTVYWTTFIPHM